MSHQEGTAVSARHQQGTAQALHALLNPDHPHYGQAHRLRQALAALYAATAHLDRVEPVYIRALQEDPSRALNQHDLMHRAFNRAVRGHTDARGGFLQALAETNTITGLNLDPQQVREQWPWPCL